MNWLPRAARHLALLLPLAVLAPNSVAQQPGQPSAQASTLPIPQALQTGDETPWIYEGSNVPQDREWLFGEMDNGLRYAVRENGVPPGQVSIRIRIDAGALHEREDERGFAHLLEHLLFRESKYLGPSQAIPTWQRLGATFGNDTNAQTTPTQTVYQLDLPNATAQTLEESFRLLSGMIREPVLSDANVATEVPIVLAERRERSGAAMRVTERSREILFAGQPLANRLPIGTEATLTGATGASVEAFHERWYRPENTVIVVAGDADPQIFAALTEKWFGDWQGEGESVPAPDFGDPVAPANSQGASPVGETGVLVEPDLPRTLTYAILRPWEPVDDTIEYNQGLMIDGIAQSVINRRLEARARAGGSYLYAQVQQDDVSRSADATFVSLAPLPEAGWEQALTDVRAVIADALASPPTQEEIDREVAEFDVVFASNVEQRSVIAGSKLADDIVNAVDIREAVASPETALEIFRATRDQFTPEAVLDHTRDLFEGTVTRAFYVTPATGEASAEQLGAALSANVEADSSARLTASTISFDELEPIGEPGAVVSSEPLGAFAVEKLSFGNGVTALLWPNDAEPGRVTVKVRFGSGYRGFDAGDAPYVTLGQMALVQSGVGELDQEDLDRISTGRRMGFDFAIEDAVFTFSAQTRQADLSDQLYLFAAKLAKPRWDPNPVIRARAAAMQSYESFSSSPGGVLQRDLDFLLRDRDPRYATPSLEELSNATPEGFRQVWEPLLSQGPVEVLIFGEFDRAQTIATLKSTFGALPDREPIPAEDATRSLDFPETKDEPIVLHHGGDANQAAAVIAWPAGAGVEGLPESRQLQILVDVFNNRLIDAMRERAGASYAPQINVSWPADLDSGGMLTAISQVAPDDVPVFFRIANEIANDLATNPPEADELARATEPLRQLIQRASTGNMFWMYQLEGAGTDQRRVELLRSLVSDYTQTTPQAMQALAAKYFLSRSGWRLAVIPEGQTLARGQAAQPSVPAGR